MKNITATITTSYDIKKPENSPTNNQTIKKNLRGTSSEVLFYCFFSLCPL